MNREENRANDALDGYLDRALAAYRDDEPRPGLEQRVLEHVQAAPQRGIGWIWIAAPAALALVAWASLSLPLSRPPKPAEVTTRVGNEVQNPSAARRESQKVVRANTTHTRSQRIRSHGLLAAEQMKKLPRLPVFPSPQPLSGAERLLLALGQRDPEQLRQIADWQEEFKKPAIPEASSSEKDKD